MADVKIQYYYKWGANRQVLLLEALEQAMQVSAKHLILCIHAKKQLDNFNPALPNALVKALKDNNKGTYHGRYMYLLTDKITPHGVRGGIAIAPFISLKLLPQIEDRSPDAIIYIPWMESELAEYQNRTNAMEMQNGSLHCTDS